MGGMMIIVLACVIRALCITGAVWALIETTPGAIAHRRENG